MGTPWLPWLQNYMGNASIQQCRDVRAMGLCWDVSFLSSLVLFFCPYTCGCNRPDSVALRHKPSTAIPGCPETCMETMDYEKALQQLSPDCRDIPAEVLNISAYWMTWMDYIIRLVNDRYVVGKASRFYETLHSNMVRT